jgi:hypothetical protein
MDAYPVLQSAALLQAPSPYMGMVFMFFAKKGFQGHFFLTFFIYIRHTFLYYRDYKIIKVQIINVQNFAQCARGYRENGGPDIYRIQQ